MIADNFGTKSTDGKRCAMHSCGSLAYDSIENMDKASSKSRSPMLETP